MSRTKRIIFVAAALVAILCLLGGIKVLQIHEMIAAASGLRPPAETITTATAGTAAWEARLTAVGSLTAVQGVTVAGELPGKVVQIAFTPGARVRAGALLLKQDTSSEEAQLRAVEARLTLARINEQRIGRLLASRTVPQSQYDDVRAQAAQAAAEADGVRAAIRKKVIRAPFGGRLGIRLVNLGQVIAVGTPIVSLQSIDPVFANFSLPQHQLSLVRPGLTVRLRTNAAPGAVTGTITAINPQVDAITRNVQVQATVPNHGERLRPGMFVDVAVLLPASRPVLAIPAPAVLYAPYGDSVFVVEPAPVQAPAPAAPASGAASGPAAPGSGAASGPAARVVRQQFVRLGERRGDFVTVLDGLKAGQAVASTGVFKLRNGQAVVIDNSLSPRFNLAPAPSDS